MKDERATASPANLCGGFVAALAITGASISVFDAAGRQSTICASDPTAARIDELQLELGEGPHWDALHTAQPVFVVALDQEPHPDWPIFAAAAQELGVGAMFAFPMSMGAAIVGVVDLWSAASGELSARDIATATRLTDRVARHAVRQALDSARDDSPTELPAAPAMRREVHQATGMIIAQLGVTATEAFSRLRAYAFANTRSMHDVAHDVITHTLDFRDIPD